MSDLIIKYRNHLFGVYLVIAMFFMGALESLHDGGAKQAFKHLSIPMALLIFGFFKVNFVKLKKSFWPHKSATPWFYCTCIYLIIMLMSWPVYNGVNALVSSYEKILIAGKVYRKSSSDSRRKRFLVYVKEPLTQQRFPFEVSELTYKKLKIGDYYGECFYQGRFGIPFRWKWNKDLVCDG